MLQLQSIDLYQFKNYQQKRFDFTEQIIGICGNNGMGKTNLLDAIYYLCFTKSYFSKSDQSTVHHAMQGMRIEGNFIKNAAQEKVVCIIRENNKKEIQLNGEEYKRFSAHIGSFPAVIIAPDDVELITGTGEIRRKFLDTLCCQLDSDYLQCLIDYNKVLQQRNSFLKISGEKKQVDEALLEVLNKQIVKPGNYIFNYRKKFLDRFLPETIDNYQQIARNYEKVQITYLSQLLEEPFEQLLFKSKEKDIMNHRTTVGIHRDDIGLQLGNEPFKNIASQGQRKSLLFALKLQEFEELKTAKGFSPILLLDDVFEKLDAERMHNLLSQICLESDSQVFITDTDKERLETALSKLNVAYQLVEM